MSELVNPHNFRPTGFYSFERWADPSPKLPNSCLAATGDIQWSTWGVDSQVDSVLAGTHHPTPYRELVCILCCSTPYKNCSHERITLKRRMPRWDPVHHRRSITQIWTNKALNDSSLEGGDFYQKYFRIIIFRQSLERRCNIRCLSTIIKARNDSKIRCIYALLGGCHSA